MNEVDGGKSMYELMLKSMNGVDVGIHEWVWCGKPWMGLTRESMNGIDVGIH
jgi:hypothetical protein